MTAQTSKPPATLLSAAEQEEQAGIKFLAQLEEQATMQFLATELTKDFDTLTQQELDNLGKTAESDDDDENAEASSMLRK